MAKEHVQSRITEEMWKLTSAMLPVIPEKCLVAKEPTSHVLLTAGSLNQSQRQEWVSLLCRICHLVPGLKARRYLLKGSVLRGLDSVHA